MPTLCGVRRRGVPPEAIHLFNERNGISKADSNIDVGVLEDCTREVMDKISPRAFCVLNPLKVTIRNWEDGKLEDIQVPRHPKEESMGERAVPFGKSLYIEREDLFDTEGPEGDATGGKEPKGWKRLLPGGMVSWHLLGLRCLAVQFRLPHRMFNFCVYNNAPHVAWCSISWHHRYD